MLQPNKNGVSNGPTKVLDAPIHLASMASTMQEVPEHKSIWINTRDESLVSIKINTFYLLLFIKYFLFV